MLTAPPNRYTNTTISITGSSSAVSSASGLRADRRRLRPVMVSASDMRGLLGGVVVSQDQENVVEAGGLHGEAGDQGAAGVGRIDQRPDLGSTALGGAALDGHAQRQVAAPGCGGGRSWCRG